MPVRDFDKMVVERADEYLHGLFGRHLMRDLMQQWHQAGVQQYSDGVPLRDVLPECRSGWLAMAKVMCAIGEVYHAN